MKTKTRSRVQLELEVPAANTTLVRTSVVDERRGAVDELQLPQAGTPIATKSVTELGVALRARLDGVFQVCTCNGTGEDGCIIDGPLVRADPSRGFASHRPVQVPGPQLGVGNDDE